MILSVVLRFNVVADCLAFIDVCPLRHLLISQHVGLYEQSYELSALHYLIIFTWFIFRANSVVHKVSKCHDENPIKTANNTEITVCLYCYVEYVYDEDVKHVK